MRGLSMRRCGRPEHQPFPSDAVQHLHSRPGPLSQFFKDTRNRQGALNRRSPWTRLRLTRNGRSLGKQRLMALLTLLVVLAKASTSLMCWWWRDVLLFPLRLLLVQELELLHDGCAPKVGRNPAGFCRHLELPAAPQVVVPILSARHEIRQLYSKCTHTNASVVWGVRCVESSRLESDSMTSGARLAFD